EYILSCAALPMLMDPEKQTDTLSVPYYFRIVGQAFANSKRASSSANWLFAHAPLALVEACRILSLDNHDDETLTRAKEWLEMASSADEFSAAFFEAERI